MVKKSKHLDYKSILQAIHTRDLSFFENLKAENLLDLPDKYGQTSLSHAINAKNPALIDWFIKNGVDVNRSDNKGWSPLHYAAQQNNLGLVKALVQAKAHVNAQDEHGNSVLWRATFAAEENGDVIKFLLQNGADRHLKNTHDISAYDLAKTIANYDLLQFFK